MARALQTEMSKALSQTMVVLNKPGAAGTSASSNSRAAARRLHDRADTQQSADGQPHMQKLPSAWRASATSASPITRPMC